MWAPTSYFIKIATFTGFISFSTFTSVLTFLWPMSQCYNSYSVSLQLKKANTHVRPLLPFKEQMSNVMIRHCLIDNQQPALLLYIVEQTETEYPGFNWLPARSCWGARSWWVPCQGNPSHHYTINREVGRGRPEEAQMRITRCQV